MSFETIQAYFEQFGMADRCMDLKESSATVALAALALGTEEARIAKTLSFLWKKRLWLSWRQGTRGLIIISIKYFSIRSRK